MVELLRETHDNVIATKTKGKLMPEDYKEIFPLVEETVKRHGKIRWLMDMTEFEGWDVSSIWQELKFDFQHFRDLEKVAIVGEGKWKENLATIMRPLTPAEVKFFHPEEMKEATGWIEDGQ